jgi:dTMP kinase
MPLVTKGMLIAIEGIDGSGKSTLAKNLATLLSENQYPTLLTREPGGTPFGKKVREMLQTQGALLSAQAQYLLFAADRAQHFNELVIPALENNTIVVSDRLSDSSLAYQCYGNGLDINHVRTINTWAMQSIVPDLTIFVKIDVHTALERAAQRGALSHFEKAAFLEKVAAGFEELYKNRADVIVLDGTLAENVIAQQAFDAVKTYLKNC